MSAGILIRPVRPSDIKGITTIYSHAVEHGTASFEIEPPSEAEMTTRLKMLLDNNYPYVVADSGGAVAGYAYAGPYRPRIAYRYSVEDSVYVHPRVMRRGIGRLLLSEVISQATERGFRQMVAVIGDSAQTSSIELHRSLGFAQVGTLANIGFKHERWLDTVLMQRPLGDAAATMP